MDESGEAGSVRTVYSAGFPPIAGANARVLILGSLPGQASLRAQQYYAQPHNAFWKIMGRLFGAGPELSYDERGRRLIASGIALWDVCAAAHRPGSLDAAIVHASVVPNDFAAFVATHAQLSRVCFNGAKAAELYRRLVLPTLPETLRPLRYETLPSTSPAHASMTFDEKLARWSVVRDASA
jgi:hypoxanthine-DNA glycosylase